MIRPIQWMEEEEQEQEVEEEEEKKNERYTVAPLIVDLDGLNHLLIEKKKLNSHKLKTKLRISK